MQCLGKDTVRGAEGTHQHDGHDDNGHVAVNDGGQTTGKTALEGTIQRFAVFQFFLDALGGDDVGVHAHADGQDDARDAGQGQGKAFKHREVAGHKGQRCRHLTGQCDAGQKARQAVQHSHEHHDQRKGDQAGQHHGAQAVLTQAGADGGVAVHGQGKGQCAGVDLACHFNDLLLREGVGCRAGDDGRAVGDGGVDRGSADVLVIQPDADGAIGCCQRSGCIAKGLGTVVGEFQGDIIFRCAAVADGAILGGCTLDLGAVQDQFTVGTAALAEGQVRGGADLLNGGFRVKIRLTGLPRELQDQAVGIVVHIQLIVGDVQRHKAVLDDKLRRFQLFFGGVVAVRGNESDIHAALDIYAEADILRTLDVGFGHITVLCVHTKEGGVHERCDQQHREDQMPCFAFCFHKIQETSKSCTLGEYSPYSCVNRLPRCCSAGWVRLPQSRRRAGRFAIKLP